MNLLSKPACGRALKIYPPQVLSIILVRGNMTL